MQQRLRLTYYHAQHHGNSRLTADGIVAHSTAYISPVRHEPSLFMSLQYISRWLRKYSTTRSKTQTRGIISQHVLKAVTWRNAVLWNVLVSLFLLLFMVFEPEYRKGWIMRIVRNFGLIFGAVHGYDIRMSKLDVESCFIDEEVLIHARCLSEFIIFVGKARSWVTRKMTISSLHKLS